MCLVITDRIQIPLLWFHSSKGHNPGLWLSLLQWPHCYTQYDWLLVYIWTEMWWFDMLWIDCALSFTENYSAPTSCMTWLGKGWPRYITHRGNVSLNTYNTIMENMSIISKFVFHFQYCDRFINCKKLCVIHNSYDPGVWCMFTY